MLYNTFEKHVFLIRIFLTGRRDFIFFRKETRVSYKFQRRKEVKAYGKEGGARRPWRRRARLRLVSLAAALALVLSLCLCACAEGGVGEKSDTVTDNTVESSSMKTVYSLSATDALGRSVSPVLSFNEERKVGIFYFLWTGEHGSTGARLDGHTLDISKLPREEITSASDIGRHHYWNEPLYGYYRSDDPWVFRKHLELFALAGIDYLAFDYTNSNYDAATDSPVNYYKSVTDVLFPVALQMQAEGWDIPKFIFMLNNASDKTVKFLYEDYYTNSEYDTLWYRGRDGLALDKNTEGKPWVICGDVTYLDENVKNAFYIKQTQWPNEAASSDPAWDFAYKDDGFPWMSWERVRNGTRKQYSHNGIMSVSIAQHVNGAFSDAVLNADSYNVNYGRGWVSSDNNGFGANDAGRVAAGTNFQEQWDYAIAEAQKGNVNNVFVTGWNEWVAQKQPAGNGRNTSYFVDLYDDEFSRDAEMSKGDLGDNYYMQLVENVRRFKGVPAAPSAYKMEQKSVPQLDDLSPWEGVAGFGDPAGDTAARDHASSNDSLPAYKDDTGRNDVMNVRALYDAENLYFLITCAKDVTAYEDGDKTWMNVLLSTGGNGWNGFDYVINRTVAEGTASVERLGADGEADGEVGTAQLYRKGRYLAVSVPRKAVGLDKNKFSFSFKVADHVVGYTDIMNYYIQGDCAPIGRFGYTVSG